MITETKEKGINESSLPAQTIGNETSNFTNYFDRVDQSVQGHMERGVSFAAQFGADNVDASVQGDIKKAVADISVQR